MGTPTTGIEAAPAHRTKVRYTRQDTFEQILNHASAMFSAAQLRVFLSALIALARTTWPRTSLA